MSEYKWEDEKEKEAVLRKIQTECIIPTKELFQKKLVGNLSLAGLKDDTRYRVWSTPSTYPFDLKDEEGVSGPLEAVQAAVELHVVGGWDWLVWDLQQQVGFSIEANSYIYAPMEAHFAERYSPKNFGKRSSEDLKAIIDAAQSVLAERKSRGEI